MATDRETYLVKGTKNRLHIIGCEWDLDVEFKEDFQYEFSKDHLSRFVRLLKCLSDQPATLDFGDPDWGITIRDIVV